MSSLHNYYTGKKSTRLHVPSEAEGLALGIGVALHWANEAPRLLAPGLLRCRCQQGQGVRVHEPDLVA